MYNRVSIVLIYIIIGLVVRFVFDVYILDGLKYFPSNVFGSTTFVRVM